MRIALDLRWIRSEQIDGISRYAVNLAAHLLAVAPEHAYLFIGDPALLAHHFPQGLGANARIVPCPHRLLSPKDFLLMPRFIEQFNVDVFHAPHYLSSPLQSRCKKILTVFDLIPFLFPNALSKSRLLWRIFYRAPAFAKRILRSADAVLTASQHTKRDIIRLLRVPPENIHVVWSGIEARFHADYQPDEGFWRQYRLPRKFLLYVGRQDPYKGLAYFVEAFALLPEAMRQEYRLVIAGKTDARYIEDVHDVIRRHRLQDAVQFLDYVADDALPLLYSAATLLVHPSLYEGFGLPPLEAMACGTPVVYADTSSLTELLGEAGMAVAPASASALAQGMRQLLDNESLRQMFRAKGLAHAQRYSWNEAARGVLDMYARVAANQRVKSFNPERGQPHDTQ